MIDKLKKVPISIRASVAYTLCSVLQKGLSFITLPLFTRLLSQEQYGQFTIFSSWSGILAIFLTLNLQYGSFSKAMVKFEDQRDIYISSVQGICLMFSVLFLLIYLPFQNLWNVLFELPTYIMIIMVVELIGQTSIQFWSGKKRFEFKYISVVVVTLLTSLTSPLIAYLLVIHTEKKGYARIIGYAIVNIVIGTFFFVLNTIKGKVLYHKEFWHYALSFNLPLIIYYLSQTIFNQSDRIMISHLVGTDKAAIYGVAYSLAMLLNFVLNAINNAYTPWYYGKLKEKRQEENQPIAIIIAVLMGVLLLGVIWLTPEIILLMAGESYLEAIWIVPPVAMSVMLLFYSQLCINVEFYFERKKDLVVASIGSALANIALNALLIPAFGYIVAGYTTLFSYILFVVCNYISMKRILQDNQIPDNSFDLKYMLYIFAAFTLLTVLGMLLYQMLYVRLAIMLLVCIGLFIKRNFVISQVKRIFSLKK